MSECVWEAAESGLRVAIAQEIIGVMEGAGEERWLGGDEAVSKFCHSLPCAYLAFEVGTEMICGGIFARYRSSPHFGGRDIQDRGRQEIPLRPDGTYVEILSPESRPTLLLQGGPMTDAG